MKTQNLLVFLMLLILSGCGITSEMIMPTKDIPSKFRGGIIDTNSIGQLPVKDFFNTPAIQQLIDSALIRNLDIQIAIKNIDAAEKIFKRSKLGNIPELNLQIAANSNFPSKNSLNGINSRQLLNTSHIEDYNANLTLSWEADIWGKIKRQKEAAFAGYLQSIEAKKAVQTRIVANVASGFYRLLTLNEQLNVAKKNVELNNNTLKMIQLQFTAGQVTSLAVQQAEAQQLKASQFIPSIAQEITLTENALSTLTGRFPDTILVNTTLSQLTIPTQMATGVPADLLNLRPDVKNVELELKIADAKVGIANARLYPTLMISANGGLNAFKASNWFNIPASLFGVVGGGITQPIFQRGALKTQFELEKIARDQAVLVFRQTVINAVEEVSNEQSRLLNLKNEYDVAQKRVAILELAVKNSDLLFKSGMANYLEVITAQSNLLQGELDLTSLKLAQLNASVALYSALGGGWH
jgi:multidrug efflux system outer membrane protein